MALRRLETVRYSLPFREPYVTARGELRERDLLLVRIEADEGTGLGETTSLSLRGGSDVAQIEREVHDAWSSLEGGQLDATIKSVGAEARCAIEMALWDLRARAEDVPLWKLLGAESGEPVRCNASLVAGEPSAVARDARRWAGRGFSSFKLKVGVERDVDQVAAVREELGPESRLRVDANGAWSVDEATERLKAMGEQILELAEEPVSGLAQQAELHERVDVRIYADESVSTPAEASEAAKRGAVDGATVKLAKVGGVSAALETASHLPVYLSSALDGPVTIAAAAHVARAIPDRGLAHGLATQLLFDVWPAAAGCELDGELLRIPEGPGIGVEIDEGALAGRRK